MKAVINEKETPKQTKYPCLKVCKYSNCGHTVYVLFVSPSCGTPIHIKEGQGWCGDKIGVYSDKWNESSFTPFTGSITLSND